jgi:hypothetical protein
MANVQGAFVWDVLPDGYRWGPRPGVVLPAGFDPAPELYVEPLSRRAGQPGVRQYTPPRDHPELFRCFADLHQSSEASDAIAEQKEEILAFANRFGALTRRTAGLLADQSQEATEAIPTGETFSFWRDQVRHVHRAVSLADMVREGDVGTLADHFRWHPAPSGELVAYFNPDADPTWELIPDPLDLDTVEVVASAKVIEAALGPFDADDLMPIARFLLRSLINRELDRPVKPQLVWDPEAGRLGLHYVPGTLLEALWLQCAEAVGADKVFHRCGGCGRWFEVSTDSCRPDRQFCSNACRSKAYRGRQDHARQMFAEGKSFEYIAEKLKSDVKTVRRWVTGRKG